MADISAKQVKELRDRTGAGMMECKKALQETDGDVDKAVELLRLKLGDKAMKVSGREATEGTVSRPIACILSCTLIGPWSSPEASSAAQTCTAWALTSSVNLVGLDAGRLDRGSSTAAGPSNRVRFRSS